MSLLEQKLESFLAGESAASRAGRTICEVLSSEDIRAYFFGGMLREIWIGERQPRDIDLVVEAPMWNRFQSATAQWQVGKNRFGGVKMVIEGVTVDAWNVKDTWAFANGNVSPVCASRLPETTLMNAEAIVMEAAKPVSGPRLCFERGFFAGVQQRMLELTPEPQIPNPVLGAVRLRYMADKLGWELSPKASDLLTTLEGQCPTEELAAARTNHYGKLAALELSKGKALPLPLPMVGEAASNLRMAAIGRF